METIPQTSADTLRAVNNNKSDKPLLVIKVIFALGILSVILSLFFFHQSSVLSSWNKTNGTITSDQIASYQKQETQKTSTKTDTHLFVTHVYYYVNASYSYTVLDKGYTSDVIFNPDYSSTSYDDIHSIVENLSPGTFVTVHYNPANPSDSYLFVLPATVEYAFLLFGIVFILVGIIIFFARRRSSS